MKAGLFAEDAKEATDITETQSQPAIPHTIWFDSMSGRLVLIGNLEMYTISLIS